MPESLKDRLREIMGDEDLKFISGLKKIRQALDIFQQQVELCLGGMRFCLTATIHSEDTKFRYILKLEIRSVSHNLLDFLFYSCPDEIDFPVHIITNPESERKGLDCKTIEDFEEFLVGQTKDIRRTISILLTLVKSS